MLLAALVSLGCSTTPSKDDRILLTGPNPADFASATGSVDGVFERRCGSFDCHGNTARAMRIYSQNGLRIPNDAGITPGTAPTTTDEVNANYRSVIGVEPEQMNDVVKNNGDPYSLLILKKPLQIETHKGGQVMNKGDDSEQCISTWIQGKTNKVACTNGAALP